MPRLLHTIEEYVATKRKQMTLYMVFHTKYNDIEAFKKQEGYDSRMDILDAMTDEQYIGNEAREEFLSFMKHNYPDVELVDVFDAMPTTMLIYPFLGSIAIDADRYGDVANALMQRYEDSSGMPLSNGAVLWEMDYEVAKKLHQKRVEACEEEFGVDE